MRSHESTSSGIDHVHSPKSFAHAAFVTLLLSKLASLSDCLAEVRLKWFGWDPAPCISKGQLKHPSCSCPYAQMARETVACPELV